jgi:hypothetical protein
MLSHYSPADTPNDQKTLYPRHSKRILFHTGVASAPPGAPNSSMAKKNHSLRGFQFVGINLPCTWRRSAHLGRCYQKEKACGPPFPQKRGPQAFGFSGDTVNKKAVQGLYEPRLK